MPGDGYCTVLAAGIAAGITAGRGKYVRMVNAGNSYPLDDLGGSVTGLSLTRIGEG